MAAPENVCIGGGSSERGIPIVYIRLRQKVNVGNIWCSSLSPCCACYRCMHMTCCHYALV